MRTGHREHWREALFLARVECQRCHCLGAIPTQRRPCAAKLCVGLVNAVGGVLCRSSGAHSMDGCVLDSAGQWKTHIPNRGYVDLVFSNF